eukprot:scaffold15689_cov135-Isochrysis_galbana.AAC.8
MPAACLLSKKKGRPPPPYHLLPAPCHFGPPPCPTHESPLTKLGHLEPRLDEEPLKRPPRPHSRSGASQNSLAAVTAAAVAAVGSRGRVRIRGHAVTTMEGRLLVFPPRPQPVVSRFC